MKQILRFMMAVAVVSGILGVIAIALIGLAALIYSCDKLETNPALDLDTDQPEQVYYAGDCVRLVLAGNHITFERIQCPEEGK